MKVILPAYVATTNYVADRKRQLIERSDRGVELVEWGAMLVLIAAIVGFLLSSSQVKETVGKKVKEAVENVFKAK